MSAVHEQEPGAPRVEPAGEVRAPGAAPHAPGAAPTAPHDDLGFDLPPPAKVTKTRLLAGGAIVAAVLGAVFLSAFLPRQKARAALEEGVKAGESARPRVQVLTPQVVAGDRNLVLPGSVQPLEEAIIYPRANGYVRRWLVDMGDKVSEGQVLAEIDTPELDKDLAQARAQLAQAQAALIQAQANKDLAATTLARTEQLTDAGVASQQDLDQRRGQARVNEAGVAVAQAAIRAQEASIQRIRELKGFARIVAPFAGTVVSRTIERGTLVSAGTTTPLFRVAATDPVRVFVAVPQDVAPSVRTEQPAQVKVREFAGQMFAGKIARTAGALDPATRTMSTEVRVPNPDGKLLTGMYAEVVLTLPVPHRVVEIPATALFNDAKGVRVAVVGPEDKVHFVPITIERDTGATIQISTGLDGSERVVKLAGAEIAEGASVEIIP